MALPGLDASVITVFVSRSPPSPILPPSFFIIVVQAEQFQQTGKSLKDLAVIYNMFVTAAVPFFFIEHMPPSHILARILVTHPPTHSRIIYMYCSRALSLQYNLCALI